jgi:hypothetical protein
VPKTTYLPTYQVGMLSLFYDSKRSKTARQIKVQAIRGSQASNSQHDAERQRMPE